MRDPRDAQRRRLRVGVTGLRGIPGVMGGIESHCEELYPRMMAIDPDIAVTIAARRPYVPQRQPYAVGAMQVVPLASTRISSLEATLNTLLAVLYFGIVRRVDLLHIHAIGPALLTPLARLLGLRTIVTHHGRDYRRAKWGGFAKWMLVTGERFALTFAHQVIVVSDTLAAELRAEFPARADRVHYIPNGVPAVITDTREDPTILDRFALRRGEFILSVGRLVPEKGFADLVAAYLRSGSTMKLVIAGGADHETPFVRELLAHRSDRVIFTGMLPRDELRTLYRGAGLFVLASHHEGLPIAALEATAVGTPTLLSDIDANLDVGLPRDRYYPMGDIAALTERLGDQRLLARVDGDAIRARFDWDRIAEQTVERYRDIVQPAHA
jgi:glycosyltransferase involved in cell wall biosynthesis